MVYVVQWGLEHRELGTLRAIGVDEIHIGQSHKFLTLVYQIEADCVRLLWVGKDRTMNSFEKFFNIIGQELAGKVEFVCSDMWRPYLEMIARHCPLAGKSASRISSPCHGSATPACDFVDLCCASASCVSVTDVKNFSCSGRVDACRR